MKIVSFLAAGAAILTAAISSAPAPAQADDLAAAFKKNQCALCHTVTGKHTVGPSLKGVIGRKAGTADRYAKTRYSKSMVAAGEKGLVWSPELIDKYIINPKKFLQDYLGDPKATTKMSFAGAKSAEERAKVVKYLESVK